MSIWNFSKKNWKTHLVELEKLENNIFDQISPCKSVGVRNRPHGHLVAQNHLQDIAKIGPFGDDFWRLRFYMG